MIQTSESDHFIFGIGSILFICTVNFCKPLDIIIFHIVQVNTSFLLCFADIDSLNACFNNIINIFVQPSYCHLVICQYAHIFLLRHISTYSIATESFTQNPCFLTDVELCCFHYWFGPPFVRQLLQVLKHSSHNIDLQGLENITKYCKHCQKHGRFPYRFSFAIKNNYHISYNIIVNIININSKSILYVIDNTTCFQTE